MKKVMAGLVIVTMAACAQQPKSDTATQAVPREIAVMCGTEAISPIPTVYALAVSCDQPIFQGQLSATGFVINDLVLDLYRTEGVDTLGLENTPGTWRYAVLVVIAKDRRISEVEDRVRRVIEKFFPNLKFQGSQT